jgi:hypothetical protein
MSIFLVSVRFDLYVTWIAIPKPGTGPKLVIDPEIRIKQMANRCSSLIEITVTPVDVAAWADNEFTGTTDDLLGFSPVTCPLIADGSVNPTAVCP